MSKALLAVMEELRTKELVHLMEVIQGFGFRCKGLYAVDSSHGEEDGNYHLRLRERETEKERERESEKERKRERERDAYTYIYIYTYPYVYIYIHTFLSLYLSCVSLYNPYTGPCWAQCHKDSPPRRGPARWRWRPLRST